MGKKRVTCLSRVIMKDECNRKTTGDHCSSYFEINGQTSK